MRHLLALLLALGALCAQTVEVYRSLTGGERMAMSAPLRFGAGAGA